MFGNKIGTKFSTKFRSKFTAVVCQVGKRLVSCSWPPQHLMNLCYILVVVAAATGQLQLGQAESVASRNATARRQLQPAFTPFNQPCATHNNCINFGDDYWEGFYCADWGDQGFYCDDCVWMEDEQYPCDAVGGCCTPLFHEACHDAAATHDGVSCEGDGGGPGGGDEDGCCQSSREVNTCGSYDMMGRCLDVARDCRDLGYFWARGLVYNAVTDMCEDHSATCSEPGDCAVGSFCDFADGGSGYCESCDGMGDASDDWPGCRYSGLTEAGNNDCRSTCGTAEANAALAAGDEGDETTLTEAECVQQCEIMGFCCTDPAVGMSQLMSCTQACLVRARGATQSQCQDNCDTIETSHSCENTFGGYTYEMCSECMPTSQGACSDPELIENLEEGNGMPEERPDACKVGCTLPETRCDPDDPIQPDVRLTVDNDDHFAGIYSATCQIWHSKPVWQKLDPSGAVIATLFYHGGWVDAWSLSYVANPLVEFTYHGGISPEIYQESGQTGCNLPWYCTFGPVPGRGTPSVCPTNHDSCEAGGAYVFDNTEFCDSNPCMNGGECRAGDGYYTCNCLPGFSGHNCDESDFEAQCFFKAESDWECPMAETRVQCMQNDGCCEWDADAGVCGESVNSMVPSESSPAFQWRMGGLEGCYSDWFCDCMVAIDVQELGLTPTLFRPWLGDGQCDEMLNRAECKYDGGDCLRAEGAAVSMCSQQLIELAPFCCENGICDSRPGFILPGYCTAECAFRVLDWYENCAFDNNIVLTSEFTGLEYDVTYPAWVYQGFASSCEAELHGYSTYCDGRQLPFRQTCDGICQCAGCEDEEPDMFVQTSAGEIPCSAKYTELLRFGTAITCSMASPICTCINLDEIPAEWRCDGISDCSLGEDEKRCEDFWAARAQIDYNLTNAQHDEIQRLWSVPTVVVGGELGCADRLLEVRGIHDPGQSTQYCESLDGSSTCTVACAEHYIPWKLDCNSSVPSSIATDAKIFFDCCLHAEHSGFTATCGSDAVDNEHTLAPCSGHGDEPVPVWQLGDGICDWELQCPEYAADAGDCEQYGEVTFSVSVIGALSVDLFRDAISMTMPEIDPEDFEVNAVQQTIHGTFTLITDPPIVAIGYTSNPPLQQQLRNGIRSLLGLRGNTASTVVIEKVEDCANTACSSVTGRRLNVGYAKSGTDYGVRVTYEVTATKNIVAVLFESNRDLLLSRRIDNANPHAFAEEFCLGDGESSHYHCVNMRPEYDDRDPSCSCTTIRVQDPTVTTGFNTSISMTAYDLFHEDSSNRPSDGVEVSLALSESLQGYVDTLSSGGLLENIQAAQVRASYPDWARASRASQDTRSSGSASVIVRDLQLPPPPPSDADSNQLISDETSVIILVIAIFLVCLVVVLLVGLAVVYRKKQKTKVVVMDQQGKIVATIEREIDDLDDVEENMLKQMFQEYVTTQNDALEQKQNLELQMARDALESTITVVVKDDLTGSGVVETEKMETEESGLADNILKKIGAGENAAPPQDYAALAVMAKQSAEESSQQHKEARENLVANMKVHRDDGLSKQGAELQAAGVEPEKVKTIIAERVAAEQQATADVAKIDAEVEQAEQEVQEKLLNVLKAKLSVTSDPAERAALQAQFQQDMLDAKAQFAASRANRVNALNARLAAKRAALSETHKLKAAGVDVVIIAESNAMVAEEQAALEKIDEGIANSEQSVQSKLKANLDAKLASTDDPAAQTTLKAQYQQDMLDSQKKLAAERKSRVVALNARLDAKRARLAMQAAGADVSIIEESKAEEDDAIAEVEKIENEIGAQELAAEQGLKANLDAKLAGTTDPAERAELQAMYEQDALSSKEKMAADRASRAAALNARLEMKRAARAAANASSDSEKAAETNTVIDKQLAEANKSMRVANNADEVEVNALINQADSSADLANSARDDMRAVQGRRKQERESAKAKLAARRAALAKKQAMQLQMAGLDDAAAEQLLAEREVVEQEAEVELEQLQEQSETEEAMAMLEASEALQKELEQVVANGGAAEEAAAIQDKYRQEMLASKAALHAERQSKQKALNARLAAKRKALAEKQKAALAMQPAASAVLDAQVDTQNTMVQLESTAEEAEVVALAAVAAAEAPPPPEVDASGDLAAAAAKEAEKSAHESQVKREAARAKLAARRKQMAAMHEKQLENAGVPPEVAQEIVQERAEATQEAEVAMELIQQEADQQAEMEAVKAAKELQEKLASAKDAEEAKAVQEKFKQDMTASQQKLQDSKKSKQSALQARLEAKRNKLAQKHKAEVAASGAKPAAVEILEQQKSVRDAAAKNLMSAFKSKRDLSAEREASKKALEELEKKHEMERLAQAEKMKEMEAKFAKLEEEKASLEATASGQMGEAKALMGDYSKQLEEAEKKLQGTSGAKKSALEARLAKKRAAMEAKAAQAAALLE
eukprot:SAG11_NODE_6_length_32111_cov_33.703174_8_plen_2418_part_00